MITAVDTNVLSDVLRSSSTHGPTSLAHLKRCARNGGLVASVVVLAELLGYFRDLGRLREQLNELGIRIQPIDDRIAEVAGVHWGTYQADRRASGAARGRVLADFLVGAHASLNAERLLTRDRGYYRAYFSNLTVQDASEPI